MTDSMRPRTALYIRVSTDEQARHGYSVEAQINSLTEWALKHDVDIVDRYIDAGVSGQKPIKKRPELMRLLNDVEAGKIDLIAFIKLDRFFRNIQQYYVAQPILEKHKVGWIATQEEYETRTSTGRMKVNIMLSVAQNEAERTSERIKFVFDDKLARGEVIGSKVPPGLRKNGPKLEIDEDTAPMIRDMFRHYILSQSLNDTRRYMIEQYGVVKSYLQWSRLLQNERYIGLDHGRQVCEPLIPVEDFKLTQRIMAAHAPRNAGRADHCYLFSGMVYCAECGHRLVTHCTYKSEKGYYYYRCPNYKLGTCGNKPRMNEDKLEAYMLEHLIVGIEQYNITVSRWKPKPKPDNAPILRKLDKLKDLYLNDLISREAYEADYKKYSAMIVTDVAEEQPKELNVSAYRDALSAYSTLTQERKREFWRRILKRIEISENGDINFTLI